MMAKTPLILLPGLLCDEALWAHQIQDLADIADMTVFLCSDRAAQITGQTINVDGGFVMHS